LVEIQLLGNLEYEGAKKLKTMRKSPLKLSIYVHGCDAFTRKHICFIFTVGNLLNIFMEHDFYLISWWFLA